MKDLKSKVVLLVEDDGDVRQVLAEQLKALGLLVLRASSGNQALFLLESFRVDLILSWTYKCLKATALLSCDHFAKAAASLSL